MWRGVLLSTLCLLACHRAPAPPLEAAPPTATAPLEGGADKPEAEHCTRDEDCALTQLAPEGCCPQCTPRAISTAALARLQRSCSGVPESSCPMPACRPPPGIPRAACEGGHCTVRFIPME